LPAGYPKDTVRGSGLPRNEAPHSHREAVEFKFIYWHEQSLLIVSGAGQEVHNHFQFSFIPSPT
jgi:hypothetical protein